MKIKKIVLFAFFFSITVFSQQQDFDNYFFYLKSYEYDKARDFVSGLEDKQLKKEAINLVDVLYEYGGTEIDFVEENQKGSLSSILTNLTKGYYDLYKNPNPTSSFVFFRKALEISEKEKNIEAVKFSLLSIILLYNHQVLQTNQEQKKLIDRYQKLIKDDEDRFHHKINLMIFNLRRIDLNYKVNDSFLSDFDDLMKGFKKDHSFKAIYFSTLGIYYRGIKADLAKRYLEKSLKLIKNPYLNSLKLRNYIHLSHLNKSEGKYIEAIANLNEARGNIIEKDSLKLTYYLNLYESDILYKKGDFQKAYSTLLLAKNQKEKLDYLKNNIEISNLNISYQTEKKEKQILIEQQEKKRNRNLFYGTSILLILGGTIAYLNLKNSRKKRLLAEQQKELEKQKNLTLIKEQEIHTINAMIDGQEKERIRIAEDLHDNIGSVLATLKLHFENLKLNREKKHFNQEELYNKTEKLIDETYLKVRSIAHAKNAGVIANQGLLVAIKIMAEKISAANQIKIYVVDYGLDNRLENSVEITVFRIIQELTTNIIKHANASEATINISQFDNSLNIIIEDDGKGFDVENTTFKSGIGIASIQKRIQHLQGTFQIDSTLEKGTSIIINIPIMNT